MLKVCDTVAGYGWYDQQAPSCDLDNSLDMRKGCYHYRSVITAHVVALQVPFGKFWRFRDLRSQRCEIKYLKLTEMLERVFAEAYEEASPTVTLYHPDHF